MFVVCCFILLYRPLVAAIVSTAHGHDQMAVGSDANDDDDDDDGGGGGGDRSLASNTFSRRRAFTKYIRRKGR